MGWYKSNRVIANMVIAVYSGLFALVFFGLASYFQLEAYLAGSTEVFSDLWLAFLGFFGLSVWHIRTEESKERGRKTKPEQSKNKGCTDA